MMRKIGLFLLSSFVLMLNACSELLAKYFPQAEGIILYEEKAVVESDIEQFADVLEFHELLTVKLYEDKEHILVLDESSAELLFDYGL